MLGETCMVQGISPYFQNMFLRAFTSVVQLVFLEKKLPGTTWVPPKKTTEPNLAMKKGPVVWGI